MINSGEVIVEDALLEGHLGITRELLAFQSPEKKYNIGSEKGGSNLIRVWNRFSSIDFFMVQIPRFNQDMQSLRRSKFSMEF